MILQYPFVRVRSLLKMKFFILGLDTNLHLLRLSDCDGVCLRLVGLEDSEAEEAEADGHHSVVGGTGQECE